MAKLTIIFTKVTINQTAIMINTFTKVTIIIGDTNIFHVYSRFDIVSMVTIISATSNMFLVNIVTINQVVTIINMFTKVSISINYIVTLVMIILFFFARSYRAE